MRRRKRFRFFTLPTAVLAVLLLIVAGLLARREKVIDPFLYHPGWTVYSKLTNTYDICVDRRDRRLVWFATAEGLRQYNKDDGSWACYGREQGLLSESVSSLADDGDSLWFSTWRGVNVLDKRTGRVGTVKLAQTVFPQRIFVVALDSLNAWVGTDGRGLYRYEKGTGRVAAFTTQNGLSDNYIYAVCFDGDRVWCGGAHGTIDYYLRSTGVWTTLTIPTANKVTRIWDIEKRDSLLWIATSNIGVVTYNPTRNAWEIYDKTDGFISNSTYCLKTDSLGVWAGTTRGLMRYNFRAKAWLALVDPDETNRFDVPALAIDDDYVWYGTFAKGVGKCFKEQVQWVTYTGGLSSGYIKTMGVVGDDLWVGFGHSGGWADRLERRSLRWRKNYTLWDGLHDEHVGQVLADSGQVYFATWNGLFVCDRDGGQWRQYRQAEGLLHNDITALWLEGHKLWLGTGRGLGRLDLTTGKIDLAGPEHTRICAVTGDGNGHVWVAEQRGTVRAAAPDGSLAGPIFGGPDTQPEQITALVWWAGALWIGTQEHGLVAIDPAGRVVRRMSKKIKVFHALDPGLADNQVKALRVVDGRLWAGTGRGITVVDRQGRCRTLGVPRGLLNHEVLSIIDDDAFVWVGHNGGITRVAKEKLALD